MCGTMGSKNQVDYVRSVLARIIHFILRHFVSFLKLSIFSPSPSIIDYSCEICLLNKEQLIKINLSNISLICERFANDLLSLKLLHILQT